MRNLLFTILLASAASSPALAAQHNWADSNQTREDRQQAREERQQAREDRQQTVRENRVERVQVREAPQNYSGQQNVNGANMPRQRDEARDARILERQQRIDNRDQRFQQRVDDRALRQQNRQVNVLHSRVPVSNVPQPGTQPPPRYDGHRSPVHWNPTWRNNSRYDWHHYRNRHRNIFHLGFYYDPFGWGYQRFGIGYRLWPAYYGNNFWINDPWYYRLPYAPPGTQWIRYYDDALLVDMYSGQVIDVIYDFFW